MTPYDQMPEHEFEAELGLPEPLPQGERILWQGAPDWRVMAREAMHVRTLSIYFAALLAWRYATALTSGNTLIEATQAVLWVLPLAVLAVGLASLLAWLVSRTSVYTITDKRVVMRVGVVLSITFNLPHSRIDAARLHAHRDGSGDLSLALGAGDQIAYVHLWPHARPWHVKRTEPTMRALADVRAVAALLSAALADSAGVARSPLPAAPQPVATAIARGASIGGVPLAA